MIIYEKGREKHVEEKYDGVKMQPKKKISHEFPTLTLFIYLIN